MLPIIPGTRITGIGVPIPVNSIDCGLVAASSVTDKVPVLVPIAVGLNVTVMTQEVPAASAAEEPLVGMHGPPNTKSGIELWMLLIVRVPVPPFVRVNDIPVLLVVLTV